MAVIIIPRRHLAQPQGRVTINKSATFADRLRVAFLPGHSADIAGDGLGVARGAGAVNKPSPLGLAAESVSNGGLRYPLRIGAIDSPVSVFVLADRGPAEADTRGSALLEIGGAGSGARILLEESGAFGVCKALYRVDAGSASEVQTAPNGPSNSPTGYGLVVTPSRIRAYCGSMAGLGSHALGGGFSAIHAGVLGEEIAWRGRIFVAYVWVGFELTPELFSELQYDPFQLVRADPLRIYSLPSGPITLGTPRFLRVTSSGFGVELDLS